MNGAGASISAVTATAAASPASPAGPVVATTATAANDAATPGTDFAALLGIGADAAPASDASKGTDPTVPASKPASDDDLKADGSGTDKALPDWLQAIRESLSLVGAMFAPGPAAAADARPGKPTTTAQGKALTTPAMPARAATATRAGTATASLDIDVAAVAATTPDAGGEPELPTDAAAPTADRKFDALLTAMGDHGSATTLPSSASGVANAALAAMPTAATGAAPAAHPAAPPMTVPPDHPQFTADLGERIVWITDAGLSSARIELHPLDLGSVSVHVQMRGDEAQVSFAADNPATRALLQDSLPQLRELLSVQGLQLLRAQVDQKVGPTRSSDTAFSQSRDRDGRGAGTAPARRVTRLKLVDAYV